MNRFFAILISLVTALSAEPVPQSLRVVTWNLQWFPAGRMGASKEEQDQQIVQVRKEIGKLNPDILLLQEVGSAQALEETLKPLGPEWRVAVVSRFKDGNFLSGQQVAIAARMPAEAVWAEAWAKGWAGAPRGYDYASFLIGGSAQVRVIAMGKSAKDRSRMRQIDPKEAEVIHARSLINDAHQSD